MKKVNVQLIEEVAMLVGECSENGSSVEFLVKELKKLGLNDIIIENLKKVFFIYLETGILDDDEFGIDITEAMNI